MSETTKFRVLITDAIAQAGVDFLREAGAEVVESFDLSPTQLAERIVDFDALIVRSGTKVTSPIIEASERLRVIGRAGAGLDNIDVSTARAVGVEVRNCPGANSVAVAELAIGMIIGLARHIPQADASMKAGKWEKKALKGLGLQGRKLGIVGFGRIGREVASRAQALGMTVLVNQPRLTPELALEEKVQLRDLPDLLAEADFVTLHVPMRPENVGLIGAVELAMMKPSAYLINTARGGIVDEAALLAALNDGTIAGAAIDVYEEEPATHSALAKHPHVIATPHIAASTDQAQSNAALAIAAQVAEFIQSDAGNIAARLSLQMVPTELVIPHEATDAKRVARLAAALQEDGLLANPPVVAEKEGKFIVLDGATRTTAFRELKLPHVVVQVVDPNSEDVTLHTWHHVVSGDSVAGLLEALSSVEHLRLTEIPASAVHESERDERTVAVLALEDGRFMLAQSDGDSDAFDVLNAFVARYTDWGNVACTLTHEIEQLRGAYEGMVALVLFRPFQPDDALRAALSGRHLPQGITRFIVPGRVLRLNVPLEILRSTDSLPTKRRWLDELVKEKLNKQRIRYYHEPVILLED